MAEWRSGEVTKWQSGGVAEWQSDAVKALRHLAQYLSGIWRVELGVWGITHPACDSACQGEQGRGGGITGLVCGDLGFDGAAQGGEGIGLPDLVGWCAAEKVKQRWDCPL